MADEQMRVSCKNQAENLILPVTFFNGLVEISLNPTVLSIVQRPVLKKIFWDPGIHFRAITEMAASATHTKELRELNDSWQEMFEYASKLGK